VSHTFTSPARRVLAATAAASALALSLVGCGDDSSGKTATPMSTSSASASEQSDRPGLPPGPISVANPRNDVLAETVNCAYLDSGAASRPVEKPAGSDVSTTESPVVALETSAGTITVNLSATHAPCTVNNLVSLAEQGYLDDTQCHRITTAGIYVLQCGDPTATGRGGPGYVFANEYPTDQFSASDPASQAPFVYPRGTVAMANAGPGTNGSQFFLVFEDSPLPPQYTVFGTIDEAGLAVLDTIADKGTEGGAGDGAPSTPVTITTAVVS
jgi:peptidyl-prolyl cis-trans isomerase B (cyclophilin B)